MPWPPVIPQNYVIENFAANFVLASTDAFKLFRSTPDGGALTVTVPPAATAPFLNGAQISFMQFGTSTVTLVAGVGVTINSPTGNLDIAAQFGIITIIQDDPMDPDIWVAAGHLTV